MPPDRHLHCCRRLVPSWLTVGPAFTVGPELVQAERSDRYRSESGRALCWACVVLAMVGHARARARRPPARPRSAPRSADRTLIEKLLEEVVDSLFITSVIGGGPGARRVSPLTWTLDLRPRTRRTRLLESADKSRGRCHGRRLTWVCGGRADERCPTSSKRMSRLRSDPRARAASDAARRTPTHAHGESGESQSLLVNM